MRPKPAMWSPEMVVAALLNTSEWLQHSVTHKVFPFKEFSQRVASVLKAYNCILEKHFYLKKIADT